MFVFITVALPFLLFPVVLALNDWSLGPSARVFPSNVSLGLLLGLAVLWAGREIVRWPRWVVYAATVLGALEILLDAHRSVWLSTAVAVAVLLLLQRTVEAKVRWVFVGPLVVAALITVAQGLGYDAVRIVVEGSQAVLSRSRTLRASG